jgi:hypothetical protein
MKKSSGLRLTVRPSLIAANGTITYSAAGTPGDYSGTFTLGDVRLFVNEATLPEVLTLSTNNNPQTLRAGQRAADIGYTVATKPALLRAGARSNRSSEANSPLGNPAADTASAPAPP